MVQSKNHQRITVWHSRQHAGHGSCTESTRPSMMAAFLQVNDMAQIRQLACAAVVGAVAFSITTVASAQRATPHRRHARPPAAAETKAPPPALECGEYLAFQVLLDEQGF